MSRQINMYTRKSSIRVYVFPCCLVYLSPQLLNATLTNGAIACLAIVHNDHSGGLLKDQLIAHAESRGAKEAGSV